MFSDYRMKWMSAGLLVLSAALVLSACAAGKPPVVVELPGPQNLLVNPNFEGPVDEIPPQGWLVYGELDANRKMSFIDVDDPERRAFLIEDNAAVSGKPGEIGITQTVPGGPGTYKATLTYRSVEGLTQQGLVTFQVRFLPSNTYQQVRVSNAGPWPTDEFATISIEATAPEGTESVRIYLFTEQSTTVAIAVKSINLYQID